MHRRTSRLFLELARRGLSFEELSSTTGYSVGTLHNLAGGHNRSAVAREKVQQFLRARIWPRTRRADRRRTSLSVDRFEQQHASGVRAPDSTPQASYPDAPAEISTESTPPEEAKSSLTHTVCLASVPANAAQTPGRLERNSNQGTAAV